jgi:hypothetical protein
MAIQIQLPTQRATTMRRWWKLATETGAANQAQQLQVVIYTMWNIWKERCRRVFQGTEITFDQLPGIIKHGILAYRVANTSIE